MRYVVFSLNGLTIKFSIVWTLFFFFWVFIFFLLCYLDCVYYFDFDSFFCSLFYYYCIVCGCFSCFNGFS